MTGGKVPLNQLSERQKSWVPLGKKLILEGVVVGNQIISIEPEKTIALGDAWQPAFDSKAFDYDKAQNYLNNIVILLYYYMTIRHSSASVDVVHYVVRKIVCSVGGATCVWPPSHWMFQTSTSCTHSLTRSITTGLWFCPVCPSAKTKGSVSWSSNQLSISDSTGSSTTMLWFKSGPVDPSAKTVGSASWFCPSCTWIDPSEKTLHFGPSLLR